jgi:hypothetical protein
MGIRQKSAVHFGGVLMLWLAILVSAFFEKRMVEQLLPKGLWRKVCDDIKVLADHDRGRIQPIKFTAYSSLIRTRVFPIGKEIQ